MSADSSTLRQAPSPVVAPQADDLPRLRRADTSERFVAFTFAGSDLVVETDADGIISYAAGSFASRFGAAPEAFVGQTVRHLVAPSEHDVLETALALLHSRGRLTPLMIRLSDPPRTSMSLAGMVVPAGQRPLRLCLTFARPPSPLADILRADTADTMARATDDLLRSGAECDLGLIEIAGEGTPGMVWSDVVEQALVAAPGAVAKQIAPGRFGFLAATQASVLAIANQIQSLLKAKGSKASVTSRHVGVKDGGMNSVQTVRALRQAIGAFGREGTGGLDKAGFASGLGSYVKDAAAQTELLREAIRTGQFGLAFQPIVSFADRSVRHHEALIRPKPVPGCEFSGPQDFVLKVEALGLSPELDLAVAARVCAAAKKVGERIALNISGLSVQDAEFRTRLITLLEASDACRAGLIIIEITETAEITALDDATETVAALRTLGVPCCLDDFGAGATDIRLLRQVKPDIVKMDGSYVAAVAAGGRERNFVAGLVEIARTIGAKVIAERIETEEEAEAMKALGIDYGQGWLFGRPAAKLRAK